MEKTKDTPALVDRFPALRKLTAAGTARQIPFIQQLSATECGAACLAMVLGYYGKQVPLTYKDAAGETKPLPDGAPILGENGNTLPYDATTRSVLDCGNQRFPTAIPYFLTLVLMAGSAFYMQRQTTKNLLHGYGFCGHGFQLSPGVGYTLAEMINEGKPRIPIDAFSISRFAGEVQPDAERLTGEFDAALASAAMRPRTEALQR